MSNDNQKPPVHSDRLRAEAERDTRIAIEQGKMLPRLFDKILERPAPRKPEGK